MRARETHDDITDIREVMLHNLNYVEFKATINVSFKLSITCSCSLTLP